MWASWFSQNSLTGLALFAMMFFIVAFVSVVIRTFRSSAEQLDERARLPLDDSNGGSIHVQ